MESSKKSNFKLETMQLASEHEESVQTEHTWNTNMCLPAGTGPTRTESKIWSYSSLSAEPT